MTRVIIPNRLLTRVPVMTFSAEENIRLQTTFSLVLSPQINKFLQLTKETIMSLDSITEKDFTLVTIDNFSEGCVHIVAYFYFDPKQGKMRFRVISEVNTALSEVFRNHGIAFAFPHQVTTFDSSDKTLINLMEQYKQHL
jgi:small-conductance mechanosensitive channel